MRPVIMTIQVSSMYSMKELRAQCTASDSDGYFVLALYVITIVFEDLEVLAAEMQH